MFPINNGGGKKLWVVYGVCSVTKVNLQKQNQVYLIEIEIQSILRHNNDSKSGGFLFYYTQIFMVAVYAAG